MTDTTAEKCGPTQGPTTHGLFNKLGEQVPNPTKSLTTAQGKNNHPLLDQEGKLSSAGAATSLKYAKPQDLPSFPSSGLQLASAGAAASLAETNKQSVNIWKPGSLPTAEKAASLASHYEVDPLPQPAYSAAGSKAALLASDRSANIEGWKARESEDGHAAAEQAVRRNVPTPVHHPAVTSDASRKALMAATGAMASSRRRADSAPIAPFTSSSASSNNAHWALKAATQSQLGQRSGPSRESGDRHPAPDAARIQGIAHSNISRQMYTAHPPVSIEVQEKIRQDKIRASAVAMAQMMYAIQQKAIEAKVDVDKADSRYAAINVHNRCASDSSSFAGEPDPLISPLYGSKLQEAAQRLAQERLAKLRDEHDDYKTYYGQNLPMTRSRLSIHKLRRRASSDGAVDELDEERSRNIRSQMSIFQSNLATVDEKKRQRDREALLAAAQRNVKASMHSMDEEVFQGTGRSSPAQRELWAAKAREKAQADSDARMANYGKVHIGGGKYMDLAEVDEVARSRIRPTLEEIDEQAELQRAREVEITLEQERRQRQLELDKQRATELKTEQQRARADEKREEKSRKAEGKRAHKDEQAMLKAKERVEREEFKMKSDIEKEQAKGKNHWSEDVDKQESHDRGILAGGANVPPLSETRNDLAEDQRVSTHISESLNRSGDDDGQPATGRSTDDDGAIGSPSSPLKGQSKVKSWFTGRFHRSSKAGKDPEDAETSKSGFIGGASLTGGASVADGGVDKSREGSMLAIAMAGRSPKIHRLVTSPEPDHAISPVLGSKGRSGSGSVCISTPSDSGEESSAKQKTPRRGRLNFKDRLSGRNNVKSADGSDDMEDFEEARDTFEEEHLAPPPKLTTVVVGAKPSVSPVRDSRFSEIL